MHRVIKIGGSLLARRDLRASMLGWLSRQPRAQRTSIIVGGGEVIEAMRQIDAIHHLETAEMHWRCVRLLRATFEIANELFPEWDVVATPQHFQAYLQGSSNGSPTLIAVDAFFVPGAEPELPPSWQTTTDAIAAHLCQRLTAEELVLLKSCEVPETADLDALVQADIVDEAIGGLAPHLPSLRVEKLPPATP